MAYGDDVPIPTLPVFVTPNLSGIADSGVSAAVQIPNTVSLLSPHALKLIAEAPVILPSPDPTAG